MVHVAVNECVCMYSCTEINLFKTSDWKRAKLAVAHLKCHEAIILPSDTCNETLH